MSFGRRGSQVNDSKCVGRIQCNIGAPAILGDRDAAGVDGFRVVVGPAIRRRRGQVHALPVGQKAGVRIYIRDDDMIVVLAEEQLCAVGGIGDAGEGSGCVGSKGRAFHRSWNEALQNMPGGGVEHDNRLGRTHEQDGAARGLAIRIERNGFRAHRRTEIDDLTGRRQRLIVRHDDRAIPLRPDGAAGCLVALGAPLCCGRSQNEKYRQQCSRKKLSLEMPLLSEVEPGRATINRIYLPASGKSIWRHLGQICH